MVLLSPPGRTNHAEEIPKFRPVPPRGGPSTPARPLARLVMEHGGAHRSESWYDEVHRHRTESYEVEIPDPPILRVTE